MQTIYVVHGTRIRLIEPDVKVGKKVDINFHEANVNGQSGLLTRTKIICHHKVRFFVPNKP